MFDLIILLIIDIAPKVLFNGLVQMLYLTIYL